MLFQNTKKTPPLGRVSFDFMKFTTNIAKIS